MRCVVCKNGETQAGTTTVVLQRGNSTIINKRVPAEICNNCGEYYLDEDVTGRLLTRAEQAVKERAEIEILEFAA